VNKLLVASLASCPQSIIGELFTSGQSANREKEEQAGTIDIED